MFKSGSTKLVKNLNQQHILNLVRIHPGISATRLKEKTHLQMSTVLYTLKVLQAQGIVKEIGFGNSTAQGGKPPVLWDLESEYGLILGMELLSSEARLVLINIKGEIKYKNIFPIKLSHDAFDIANQITRIVKKTQKKLDIQDSRILGFGIGIPGTIDNENGIINYSYSFDFHNVNFRKILSEFFDFNIEIDNDANVGVLGVKWLNKEEYLTHHILYLSINKNFPSIGAGFLFDHNIYRGINSAAGEIQSYIAKTVWNRILNKAVKKFGADSFECFKLSKDEIVKQSAVIKQAKLGSLVSIFILKEVAKELSNKIAELVNLLNPEVVIIGGDIYEAEEFIAPIIKERVASKIISEVVKNTPIKFSQIGVYSGAIGGSALILKKYFTNKEPKVIK
jgi:predicted NBD/HSP70 family sugar kinase